MSSLIRSVLVPKASLIANTPAGGIVSTTVQAAINELDGKKVQSDGLAAPGGSELVGTSQDGKGSVLRTVKKKNSERVTPFDFGAVGDGVTDDTLAIQHAINSNTLEVDGLHKTYRVKQINGKSFQKLKNFKLEKIGSAVSLVNVLSYESLNISAPISGVELEKISINGRRATETGIAYPSAEDGGRSGFRFRGYIDGVMMRECSASDCATDGLIIYAAMTAYAAKNIIIYDSVFDKNRRHGISADSLKDVQLYNCKSRGNGLTQAGETVLTNGNYGANLGTPAVYGNGLDIESYGPGMHCADVLLSNCEMTGNAKSGLLMLETADWNSAGYFSWLNIAVIGGKYDKGTSAASDGISIDITPNTSIYTPKARRMVVGLTLHDIDLVDGSVLSRYCNLSFRPLKSSGIAPPYLLSALCETLAVVQGVPMSMLITNQGGSISKFAVPSISIISGAGALSAQAYNLLSVSADSAIYQVSAIYTPTASTVSAQIQAVSAGGTALIINGSLVNRADGTATGKTAPLVDRLRFTTTAETGAGAVDIAMLVMIGG